MNWRNTFILVGTATGLALLILFIERPLRLARSTEPRQAPVLHAFNPATVTRIQIQSPTNQVTLLKTNGVWNVATPALRRAEAERVELLLERVSRLSGKSILGTEELRNRPDINSEFALDPPSGSLILESPGSRSELRFGALNVNGSQIFYQVTGVPGIFLADAELVGRMPSDAAQWRDTTLVPLDQVAFDRIRVVSEGGAFTLGRSVTNAVWELIEPRPARADTERVDLLLRQLSFVQVTRFFAPTSTPAGVPALGSPRLTLSLRDGSNEVFGIAFGTRLTNTTEMMALRAGEDELLAVPADTFDLLPQSYTQLLDTRILRFNPAAVREILVEGREDFRIVLTADGWKLEPSNASADQQLVARLLALLARFEILDLAKEVVTPLDLPTYGLAPPATRITLRAEPGSALSNIAVLELGTFREGQVFARVPDEGPVYALNPAHVMEVPDQSWRLRDRGLWRFEPETVNALKVQHQGLEWTIHHPASNQWTLPAGWRDELNPFALEEAVYQFGRTRVLAWVGEGPATAANFGTTTGPQLEIQFRGTTPLPPIRLGFGKASPAGNRYTTMTLPDDTLLTFELSGPLCDLLWKEIGFTQYRPGNVGP